jgi:hypothetical protein
MQKQKRRASIFKPQVMNGWRDAPHCWRYYLFLPFGWEKVQDPKGPHGWFSLSFFGFVFFWTW